MMLCSEFDTVLYVFSVGGFKVIDSNKGLLSLASVLFVASDALSPCEQKAISKLIVKDHSTKAVGRGRNVPPTAVGR